ncbi:MAG TPA: 4Fe-4S double cluster binding domain-containing protein, partial [Rectinemataceae bacterium]|nr:4Fe-4S double cluster binding domain-containing protein [Rectinemataceae bacterium]
MSSDPVSDSAKSTAAHLRARNLVREVLAHKSIEFGISALAFLDRKDILPFVERYPEASRRYGLDSAGLVLTAALAFGDGLGVEATDRDDAAPGPASAAASTSAALEEAGAAIQAADADRSPKPTLARIARFARANWYAEMLSRLGLAAEAARKALEANGLRGGSAKQWHRLANSGLPERPLALAAGLGLPGRSGLLLVPGIGPGVVLGLLLVPEELVGPGPSEPACWTELPRAGSSCGSCRACVDACPTGALGLAGDYDRELCIQHWTSRDGELPDLVAEAWADRLYGCDECTVSCPRFSRRAAVVPTRGVLGP